MPDLATHDWGSDLMFDGAIVGHGLAPHMRDYDVIVEVSASKPDGSGSYTEGRYRYRFTHCVEVSTESTVPPETWKLSWADHFTSYSAWEDAGAPDGFVWGVNWAEAYPGPATVASSDEAAVWTEKLGRTMHEVRVETNAYTLRMICHDLRVERLAVGDPQTGDLTPVDLS